MGGLGSRMSSVNSLIAGDTLGLRYDIYKMNQLGDHEYFKVEDLLDLNRKFVIHQVSVSIECLD